MVGPRKRLPYLECGKLRITPNEPVSAVEKVILGGV
jgi:hypothetical protein